MKRWHTASHKRRAIWHTDRRGDIEFVESGAAARDGINIGRLDDVVSITTEVIRSVLVINEHQKIRLFRHHRTPRMSLGTESDFRKEICNYPYTGFWFFNLNHMGSSGNRIVRMGKFFIKGFVYEPGRPNIRVVGVAGNYFKRAGYITEL